MRLIGRTGAGGYADTFTAMRDLKKVDHLII
jgi:hypothetical protein